MELLPLLAPLALAIAALLGHLDSGVRPKLALAATRAAATFALAVAALTATLAAFRGPLTSGLLGISGLGFSVRIDGLSAVMLALIAALGAAVIQFSRNYLDGDERQAVFLGDLSLTISCVMLVVLSGNLVQLVVMWSATSLALHRLLLFYPERRGAVVAARKKFVVARAGDICLVAACFLLVRTFGTGDICSLAERMQAANNKSVTTAVQIAAALIVLTAALKAAQFPGHGWLTEMNETPTPVSALLHAGILNGGTFLVVRLAPVVQVSAPALWMLIVIGGFTALFSSVVMVTESRVKVALGYSSAAHMGFMLLLCGIGAYTVAIVHLVAHSFYKAHAFLSSGSAVDAARAAIVPEKETTGRIGSVLLSFVIAGVMVSGIGAIFGFSVFARPTILALAIILSLGLMQLIAQAARGGFRAQVVGRSALAAATVALSFFALEVAGVMALKGAIPEAPAPSTITLALTVVVVSAFAVVSMLQAALPSTAASGFLRAAYVHVRNGLYANTYFDRVVGAAKLSSSTRGNGSTRPRASLPLAKSSALSAEAVRAAVERVSHAHAPVWPLQTFVAVNPYLGFADRPFEEAAATMARVAGARTTMPRQQYLDALKSGRIRTEHVTVALAETTAGGRSDLPTDTAAFLSRARTEDAFSPKALPTVADVVGELTKRDWSHIVTERIGAWAATYFDRGQTSWHSPWRDRPGYEAWQAEASIDRTPEIFGAKRFRAIVALQPRDARAAIEQALGRLEIPEAALDCYLQRLLASVGGWAAFARHLVWTSELHGNADSAVEQILALRLAWEVALLESFAALGSAEAWATARTAFAASAQSSPDLAIDLVLQSAYEKTWQEELISKLPASRPTEARTARPAVQAAFCIDVRSEVFRRAFEEVDAQCETIGFAGFFGFPIEYVPLGQERGGAQCPVLLTTAATVTESVLGVDDAHAAQTGDARVMRRRANNAWKSFKSGAIACFSFVGPVGLAYAPKLLSDALGLTRSVPHPAKDGIGRADADRLGPLLVVRTHHGRRVGLTDKQKLAMAEGLLRGMSLNSDFARIVMLVGHGSTTVNNPHAAGLDCGACGGHTGEANARVAAAVLNEPGVRAGLEERGVHVPKDTVFLGCLHDTTTDEVKLFDVSSDVRRTHGADLERLRTNLAAAGEKARRLRAPLLGERADGIGATRLLGRSRDWSQVRPEWGLAGCAAFIVAPRFRTSHVNLEGRSFLHSYDWRADAGFSVLELVMTAPMVVGSWISLQYYASTVDNHVFGCGNKVLHNVVGTVGVLEGNSGDLRTGLPWQSVHDGHRLVHEPMRLNVLIEAPIEAMNAILSKHDSVRALADNGWLHLFAMGEAGQVTHRYVGDLAWEAVAPTKTELAA